MPVSVTSNLQGLKTQTGLQELAMQSRIMSEDEIKKGKKSEWFRLCLTGYIKNFPMKICQLSYITSLVLKNNRLSYLPTELVNLSNLINLDASNNVIKTIPSSFGDMHDLKILLLNDNKIKDLPYKLGRLHNLRSLSLENNPLNSEIGKLYSNGSEFAVRNMLSSMLATYYSYYYQVTQPPSRSWRKLGEPTTDGMQFTLLCYNVLCPKYATPSQYPYCPSWCLNWDYRRRGILEEIRMYNADIICLQELETLEYEEAFRIELEKRHYQSAFLPKSRSRTMFENDSKNVDGCAIFWKKDKFEKVYEFFHEFMHSCTSVSDNPAPVLLNRVMTKDNVALGVIFKTKDQSFPPRKLCVTTGHIHWDPEYSDVKLIQTIMWTTELRRHIEHYLTTCDDNDQWVRTSDIYGMPVIVCGDFNSLPDSGVVDYLMAGGVNCGHEEFRGFGSKYSFADWTGLECEGSFDGDRLRHGFRFDRAYKPGLGMKWSNYTYDFRGMIDYIFFTWPQLRLLGSLDMVNESWFTSEKIVGCPHVHHHSDHFSLLVELELASVSDRQLPPPPHYQLPKTASHKTHPVPILNSPVAAPNLPLESTTDDNTQVKKEDSAQ